MAGIPTIDITNAAWWVTFLAAFRTVSKAILHGLGWIARKALYAVLHTKVAACIYFIGILGTVLTGLNYVLGSLLNYITGMVFDHFITDSNPPAFVKLGAHIFNQIVDWAAISSIFSTLTTYYFYYLTLTKSHFALRLSTRVFDKLCSVMRVL